MSNPISTIAKPRNEQWWQLRHQQKCQQVSAVEQQPTIIFLGDSITHAWEVEGQQAWQQHFSHLNALNLGYAGDCTEHLLWRIKNGELNSLSPQWVVLLIGTNNAGHRHDKPEEIAAGIKTILQEITQRLPNCKIMLMAIFPRSRNTFKPMRKTVNATNQIIQSFAVRNSIYWLDINDLFLTSDGVLLESIMPDLLHPNEAQYSIWAEAIKHCINTSS